MSNLNEQDIVLLGRLNRHPALRVRVESLLGAVENETGELEKADAAERRLIEEMRRMGKEALTAWAEKGIEDCTTQAHREPGVVSGGKKSSTGTPPLATSRSKSPYGG